MFSIRFEFIPAFFPSDVFRRLFIIRTSISKVNRKNFCDKLL